MSVRSERVIRPTYLPCQWAKTTTVKWRTPIPLVTNSLYRNPGVVGLRLPVQQSKGWNSDTQQHKAGCQGPHQLERCSMEQLRRRLAPGKKIHRAKQHPHYEHHNDHQKKTQIVMEVLNSFHGWGRRILKSDPEVLGCIGRRTCE